VPRLSEYTAQEIATLQSRLDRQLGPEYLSTRQGPGGGKVHYIAAEKVINLANEVFGFNGWSHSIQNVHVDFVSEKDGKISLSCSIVCRVTLRDGTYHEDIGCGSIENARSKAAAFEKAKKEAATDSLKRALKNFGNVLGNCLYDKDYLGKVTKLKVAPVRWDSDNLHRHPMYSTIKKESIAEATSSESKESIMTDPNEPKPRASMKSNSMGEIDYEDEFGGNLFEEVDFTRPDEVVLHDTSMVDDSEISDLRPNGHHPEPIPQPQQRHQISRVQSLPVIRPLVAAPGHNQCQVRPQVQQRPLPGNRPPPPQGGRMPPPAAVDSHQHQRPNQPPYQQNNIANQPRSRGNSSTPENPPPQNPVNGPQPNGAQPNHDQPVGFIHGRAAEMLRTNGARNVPPFNPHADSPLLRRTTGIEHKTTRPIRREDIAKLRAGAQAGSLESAQLSENVPPIPGPANGRLVGAPTAQNFVNPQADANRKIGMPGSMQSPLANRGAYKPPGPTAGVKRGPDGVTRPDAVGNRQPLNDVSNVKVNANANTSGAGGDGLDTKRQRLSG
jgi:DNA repair and recombination protein RAD52